MRSLAYGLIASAAIALMPRGSNMVLGGVVAFVIGHFTLYNLMGWQFVLAEAGGVTSRTAALASNPFEPKIWSDRPSEVGHVSQAWLAAPAYPSNLSDQTGRFEAILKVARSRRVRRAIDQIIAEEFERCREGGDTITEEAIARISDRAARLFLGLESSEQLSSRDVLSLLRAAASGG